MLDLLAGAKARSNGCILKFKARVENESACLIQTISDMNPTTDHVHVPEGPITRSKVKKIQEAYTLHLQKLASVQVETKTFEPKNLYSISISNQEDNGVADIGK